MDGVINVLKPPGMTSMDVIAVLRRIVKEKKGGHIGTLDPGVSGVLPVFMGKATRAIHYIPDGEKKYRGELTLGAVTDTQDSGGEITGLNGCDVEESHIVKAVYSFMGKSFQMPPMYSAKKIGGIKLVDMARQGLEVERKKREIEIFSLNIIRIKKGILRDKPVTRVLFDVMCSRGTYIRTLCSDIGEALGCGGHMSFLTRTASGIFHIENTVTIEEVKAFSHNNMLSRVMISIDSLFSFLPGIYLTETQKKDFLNGHRLPVGTDAEPGLNRIFYGKEHFLGLGMVAENKGIPELKIEKQFVI